MKNKGYAKSWGTNRVHYGGFNENDDQERTQKLSLVEPLMLGQGSWIAHH